MSPFSAGTDHSAGSVPCCAGSRDGSEASSSLVGGLADPGPCPAQPGRGGPGELAKNNQPNEQINNTYNEKRVHFAETSTFHLVCSATAFI